MFKAYLSLGSNIEPKLKYLSRALKLLQQQGIQILQASSIYQTPPWGNTNQQPFLNMVVKISTLLSPFDLLHQCQHIEKQLDRVREVHWGPRTIDIDILLYEEVIYNSEELTLPHPSMHQRGFVLVPLQEISPQIHINGRPLSYYLKDINVKEIKKI